MKRLPKIKSLDETLNAKQRAIFARLSKHSKRSLAAALSVIATNWKKSEIDHIVGFMEGADELSKVERDYKVLKRHGAAL